MYLLRMSEIALTLEVLLKIKEPSERIKNAVTKLTNLLCLEIENIKTMKTSEFE